MTNTMKKVTKRDNFNALLAIEEVANNSTLVEFINHELELLSRKNSAERKPTADQLLNTDIKKVILEIIADEGMTATEILKADERLEEMGVKSNQKITSLLRQLMKEEKVQRLEVKGKAYFKAM